jgi:hypothetical protein
MRKLTPLGATVRGLWASAMTTSEVCVMMYMRIIGIAKTDQRYVASTRRAVDNATICQNSGMQLLDEEKRRIDLALMSIINMANASGFGVNVAVGDDKEDEEEKKRKAAEAEMKAEVEVAKAKVPFLTTPAFF